MRFYKEDQDPNVEIGGFHESSATIRRDYPISGCPRSLNFNRDGWVSIPTARPIQDGNNSSNGNKAYLTIGGTGTNTSIRMVKENITSSDGNGLLNKIANLSVTNWNFKLSTEKHVGPIAEKFVDAFDTGVIRESDGKRDDMYLSSGDNAGVALARVQELLKKIELFEKRIAELEAKTR